MDGKFFKAWREASEVRVLSSPRGSVRVVLTSSDNGGLEVEIVRSTRRTRTVSASRQGDRIVVRVPARLPHADVDRWVATLVERVLRAEQRAKPSDGELMRRANLLSARYLHGQARPVSVVWSARQQCRWGSCTPADGAIRISQRLAAVPGYVLDMVLLHELAHLIEPDHGPEFKALVANYPDQDRADAFLAGWSAADAAAGREPPPELD